MGTRTKFVRLRPVAANVEALLSYVSMFQDNVDDFAGQLEDVRRGVIAYPSRTLAGGTQLGEDAVVRYTGGAATVFLPPADLRGRGRGQIILVLNGGTGTLTVKASGTNTLAAAVALTTGKGVVLVSDGYSGWTPIGLAAAGGASPLTTKGDVFVHDATVDARLPVGTNGQVITADNTQALGVKWATPAGSSGAAGIATVNFGAFPGSSDATVAITGQASIVSGSVVQAWIEPLATADHTEDEHVIETIDARAKAIVAGTGFTIHARNTSQLNEPSSLDPRAPAPLGTRLTGQFSVGWRWS